MQNVGLGPMTVDAGSISTTHAYVVQHGGFLHKLYVEWYMPINETLSEGNSKVSNLSAMMNQHPVIIITGCVVSLDD